VIGGKLHTTLTAGLDGINFRLGFGCLTYSEKLRLLVAVEAG